jgi:lysophospholipase L1-like esterase
MSAAPTKTLVCFGDSNTWGYVPGSDGERFPRDVRWPGRLQQLLGEEWDVVSEGLNGRTAAIERPDSEGRNGLPYLIPCLLTHAPVDVVVIYLGTNDVNYLPAEIVARSVARLVREARRSEAGPSRGAPRVIVVCPPPFNGNELGPLYREVCDELGCELVDLDGLATYPVVNGDYEHLGEPDHAALADAVARLV